MDRTRAAAAIALFVFTITVVLAAGPAGREDVLRFMSFNIRMDTARDAENAWPHRTVLVKSLIDYHHPQLIGMQEVLHGQLQYLSRNLEGYRHIGVGRDDGAQAGEYSPVFYQTSTLELIDSGTFWLSLTPDKPGSKDWDSSLPRICTWGKFRHLKTGEVFCVFNTHYDHRGEEARLRSSRVILNRIKNIAGSLPVVILGDFNARQDSPPVSELLAAGYRFGWRDTGHGYAGPGFTFHGFDGRGEEGNVIDHIFFDTRWVCLAYQHIDDHWGDRWPSDHLPVVAEACIASAAE